MPNITNNHTFNIVQLSDLHLTGSIGQAPSYQRFLAVFQTAKRLNPDLWLLTGDLVNDGNSNAYDWLFNQLKVTKTPYLAIAGNHDVTHEIGIHLAHQERIHVPILPDQRLKNCFRYTFQAGHDWQILLLNSSVSGEIFGALDHQTLLWLDQTLTTHFEQTIIALHHHPTKVGSDWIDAHLLKNHQDFWCVIKKHAHVHTILCGHVHQVHMLHPLPTHQVQLLSCPSTDRQFMPFVDNFQIADTPAGCRMIQIDNKGIVSSYIQIVQNTHLFCLNNAN